MLGNLQDLLRRIALGADSSLQLTITAAPADPDAALPV